MARLNPLLWPKLPAIWSYWIAVVSVSAALLISRWPTLHLQDAPVSLFLCAVILTAWFGGVWPGLLATALSAIAFYYYFLPPIHSLNAKPEEIPRFAIFMVSALFVGSLTVAQRDATESLRRARDDLKGTVQQLQRTNEVLQAASRERDRAEESLRRSDGYLAEAQRLTHTGSWVWQVAGRDALHLSEEWYRIYGFDPEAGAPTWEERLQRVYPEDRAIYQATIDRAIGEKSDYEAEFRILIPPSTIRYIHTVGHPVVGASGDLVQFVGSSADITERKRAQGLREGESRILEMIAREAPLEGILENLARGLEAPFTGFLCSVLLLDEDGLHARQGAAPSLPEAYSKAIDGLCIGPKAGSCGTAMYRRETVVVTDILQDSLWEPYRAVAEPYGLRACWSTPILAHSGEALGSFAMYYREPRSPSPAETHALEMATNLGGIAIERKLAREERE